MFKKIIFATVMVLSTIAPAYAKQTEVEMLEEIKFHARHPESYVIFKKDDNGGLVAPGTGKYKSFAIYKSPLLLSPNSNSWVLDMAYMDGYNEQLIFLSPDGKHVDFDNHLDRIDAAFISKKSSQIGIYGHTGKNGKAIVRFVFQYETKLKGLKMIGFNQTGE